MKTKQIKGKLDILLVDGLPKGNDHLIINKNNGRTKLEWEDGRKFSIEGNWKYISTIEFLSDKQADGLVEKQASDIKIYLNYNKCKFAMGLEAIESFHSLLSANDVYSKNVFGEKPLLENYQGNIELFKVTLRNWKEGEQNVFSPSTTLIFVKE